MARPTKSDDLPQMPKTKAKRTKGQQSEFTSDMRIIVTRNQRNVWQDENYDSPPTTANQPVFN